MHNNGGTAAFVMRFPLTISRMEVKNMEAFLSTMSAFVMLLFVLWISGIAALEHSDNQLLQEQQEKEETK